MQHPQEDGGEQTAIFIFVPSPVSVVLKEEGVCGCVSRSNKNFRKQLQLQHSFNWIQLFGKSSKIQLRTEDAFLHLEVISEAFSSSSIRTDERRDKKQKNVEGCRR